MPLNFFKCAPGRTRTNITTECRGGQFDPIWNMYYSCWKTQVTHNARVQNNDREPVNYRPRILHLFMSVYLTSRLFATTNYFGSSLRMALRCVFFFWTSFWPKLILVEYLYVVTFRSEPASVSVSPRTTISPWSFFTILSINAVNIGSFAVA